MTGLIIFLLLIAIAYKPCAKYNEKQKKETERKVREEIERQKAKTQALLRKQREMEREQARIAKEQEKQAAAIAKHEEQIANLTFRIERAEQDMEYLNERMSNLMAKRDNYMAQQAACAPNSADWDKWQTKIISLDNQINSAESRLDKAKFTYEQAKAKLSA